MLGILDYKAGNQTSVRRALEHLGIPCLITDRKDLLEGCSGLLFPGVGAAGQAMEALRESGLDALLVWAAKNHKPVLGICLGCQILLDHSEENDTSLLSILPGRCRRFASDLTQEDGSPAPVPHMGWNTLTRTADCPLFTDVPKEAFFYFVHSYFVEPDPSLILATTRYGTDFCSVYGRDGLWGVQFHPEKSGRPGLTILENFYRYCRDTPRT